MTFADILRAEMTARGIQTKELTLALARLFGCSGGDVSGSTQPKTS